MNVLSKLSLVHRFLLAGFLILLAAMAFIGTWVGNQIEAGVISSTGAVTDTFLEGAISPHLQSLANSKSLEDADRVALDRILAGTHIGEHIVALKLWGPDGTILYSSADPSLVGGRSKAELPPASAYHGEVRSRIVDQRELDSDFKDGRWSRLIETYAPIRSDINGSILAVAGFYQAADSLDQRVRAAQLRSWGVQGAVTLAMLVLLVTLVRRANHTIAAQQRELSEKVNQLTGLLAQNEQLHERVSRAAARTTALNEQFLRHVATDLHDGPGQGLALASMRIESLAAVCSSCAHSTGENSSVSEDFRMIHLALQSALTDMRAILRGLHLPEIEQLSIVETVRRALSDHERKTGVAVSLTLDDIPDAAPLPVRITLFRVLQESLANGFRHGGSSRQRVMISDSGGQLVVEVADDGKGFDPGALVFGGHLGLKGMRERVEVLGGNFKVKSAPNQGTVIRVSLPLAQQEHQDA